MDVYTCVEVRGQVSSLVLYLFFFKLEVSLNGFGACWLASMAGQKLADWLEWLASKHQGSSLSPPCQDSRYLRMHWAFYMGAIDLNSGLHVCAESSLLWWLPLHLKLRLTILKRPKQKKKKCLKTYKPLVCISCSLSAHRPSPAPRHWRLSLRSVKVLSNVINTETSCTGESSWPSRMWGCLTHSVEGLEESLRSHKEEKHLPGDSHRDCGHKTRPCWNFQPAANSPSWDFRPECCIVLYFRIL